MRLVPRTPLSLQDRVSLTGLAVLTAWIIVLTVAVNVFVAGQLRNQSDDVLRTRAQAAATTLDIDAEGAVTIRDGGRDSAIDVGTWIFEGSTPIEKPARGSGLDADAHLLAGQGPLFAESDGVLWYAEPVYSDGVQRATVVTSLSTAAYQSTRRALFAGTAVLALLLLLAVWFTLRAGVGRALRPVAEMTHQSARWSADDVNRRFGPGQRPEELEDLARTLDELLDRLSAVLRHEKRLSEEISHELRTPVARIMAEVELLQRQPHVEPSHRAALQTIASSTQEMVQVLDVLMATARQAGSKNPGRCDVREVLGGLADTHSGGDAVVNLQPGPPTMASVDAEVLTRAMNPILENSVRFAASTVTVSVTSTRVGVDIAVRDDGHGIDENDLADVFEPGWSRSDDPTSGAGLGLSLSRRLVVGAGGSVEALPCESGALFIVHLPSG